MQTNRKYDYKHTETRWGGDVGQKVKGHQRGRRQRGGIVQPTKSKKPVKGLESSFRFLLA